MITRRKNSPRLAAVNLIMIALCIGTLMSFDKKPWVSENNAGLSSLNNVPDIAPVDFNSVTTVVEYGKIVDPATNKPKNHTGIDFQLNAGSEVMATADGVVVVQSFGEKPGNYVVIRHNEKFTTRYYHFSKTLVKVGNKVSKGQVIGLVGNTGLSTIPHLHYEVLRDYIPVDPKDYLPELPGS